MAEFKEIIRLFNDYCESNLTSGNSCNSCHFNYKFNSAHTGCVNCLARYPDDAEQFLTAWKQDRTSNKDIVTRFVERIRRNTELKRKLVSQSIQQQQAQDDKDRPVCTLCGKVLDEYDTQEGFGFNYYIGYGSRHDLSHAKARFCCECFDGILDAMKEVGASSPIVGEYIL